MIHTRRLGELQKPSGHLFLAAESIERRQSGRVKKGGGGSVFKPVNI